MNTTHDYHRLAQNGFKGLERIERERRIDAVLVKIGNALLWFLAGAAFATLWR